MARRLQGRGGVPGGLCPRGGAPKGTIPNRAALLAVRDEAPMALLVSEVAPQTPQAPGPFEGKRIPSRNLGSALPLEPSGRAWYGIPLCEIP